MDWGFRTGMNSDSGTHSEMRPGGRSTAPDIEIKEEVGELFMGRSIDEGNEETIFPSGLILIHHQPTITVKATEGRTETHLLSYTLVYMDQKGTPSFLQTSTRNTSIIRTNNSEIQFVPQAIQPKPTGRAQISTILHPSMNSAPKDPLEILQPNENHE